MFKLSPYQIAFGMLLIIYSLLFHYFLNQHLFENQWTSVIQLGVVYFIIILITALFLGIKDPIRRSRLDQGFHYHLIAFLCVNTISLLWPLFDNSAYNTPYGSNYIFKFLAVGGWGIGLLVHYFLSKETIKGIPKGEVFD